jgi:hypothetical protein
MCPRKRKILAFQIFNNIRGFYESNGVIDDFVEEFITAKSELIRNEVPKRRIAELLVSCSRQGRDLSHWWPVPVIQK